MKILGPPSSGSIAGETHSHNRAGQYVRNRRMPTQPIGTGRRAIIRSAFGAASSAWASIGSAAQAAWTTYADAHPVVDSLGQSINLTGHQMYVAVNTQNLNIGQVLQSIVPARSDTLAPVLTAYTAVASTGVVTMTLDGGGFATDFILVAFARPQSSGRTFVSSFWQADVLPGDSVGNATEGAKVVAQFGTLSAGQRLFIKLTPVNEFGVTGTPLIRFCNVT